MIYLISYILIGLLFTSYRDFFVTHYTQDEGFKIVKDFLIICVNWIVGIVGWPVFIILCYRADKQWKKEQRNIINKARG